jgi:hypothetical protein
MPISLQIGALQRVYPAGKHAVFWQKWNLRFEIEDVSDARKQAWPGQIRAKPQAVSSLIADL